MCSFFRIVDGVGKEILNSCLRSGIYIERRMKSVGLFRFFFFNSLIEFFSFVIFLMVMVFMCIIIGMVLVGKVCNFKESSVNLL